MSRADDLHAASNPSSITVPTSWDAFTPSADAFPKPLRAIRANAAGTVTCTMPGGAGKVLNFLAGETRYGIFTHVTAATATGLEGAV